MNQYIIYASLPGWHERKNYSIALRIIHHASEKFWVVSKIWGFYLTLIFSQSIISYWNLLRIYFHWTFDDDLIAIPWDFSFSSNETTSVDVLVLLFNERIFDAKGCVKSGEYVDDTNEETFARYSILISVKLCDATLLVRWSSFLLASCENDKITSK